MPPELQEFDADMQPSSSDRDSQAIDVDALRNGYREALELLACGDAYATWKKANHMRQILHSDKASSTLHEQYDQYKAARFIQLEDAFKIWEQAPADGQAKINVYGLLYVIQQNFGPQPTLQARYNLIKSRQS